MAPKKSKRTTDNIGARLALVMKSGKVTLGYKSTLKVVFDDYAVFTGFFAYRDSRLCDPERPNSSSSLAIAPLSE